MLIGGENIPEISFDPLWKVLIVLIPAVINLTLCCYVGFRLPRTKLNHVFINFLFFLSIWQIAEALAKTSSTFESAAFFTELSIFPLLAVPTLGTNFILTLTSRNKLSKSFLYFGFYYVTPILLAFALTSRGYSYEIKPASVFNWTITPQSNFLTAAYLGWTGLASFGMVYFSWTGYLREKNNPKRSKWLMVLALGFSAPIVLGIIFEIILPLVFASDSIPVTNISVLTFTLASFYTIFKNNLLKHVPKNEWKYILNNMDEGLVILDSNNKIRYANRKALTILECIQPEQGKFDLDAALADSEFKLNETIFNLALPDQLETIIRTAKGNYFPVKLHFKVFVNDESGKNEVLVIITNLHELRSAEKQAIQKSKDLSDFLYKTSHDLKNPVVCIEGLLSIYQEATPAEREKCMELIGVSNNKIKEILHAISSITTVSQHVIQPSRFELAELLSQRTALVLPLGTTLHVRHNLQEDVVLNTDKKLMTYLIDELIVNAHKFQRPLVKNSFLDITLTTQGNYAVLSFTDNGLGIPEKVSGELFSVFFRAHEHSGKGLGLYSAKWTAEKLGIDLTHSRTVAGLTRFSIQFPSTHFTIQEEQEQYFASAMIADR